MNNYTNSQISVLINEHIHSDRDRKLLHRRLVDGIRFEPLSEEFQLSVRQTKNIVRRGKNTLSDYIPND